MTADAVPESLSPRERTKARIRQAILQAAASKFADKGVGGATMDEIADEAAVGRATLFKYFPGKADLVAAIVLKMDEEFIELVDRETSQGKPLGDRILAVFRKSGRALEARKDHSRAIVAISEQGWGEGMGAARSKRMNATFRRLIDGEVPAEDLTTIAEILAGTYVGIIHNWRISSDYRLAEHLDSAARLISEMLNRRQTGPEKR